MADKGLGTNRLVFRAKNKEELMKQLERLVTDKEKKSLIGHIECLVCDKGKVVQCQLPMNIDKEHTSSTLDNSAIAEDKPETPPLMPSGDEDDSVQPVEEPVQDGREPEEKETLRKFTYESFLTAEDCNKVTFEEFMTAAHGFGANAEEASAQDLRGYFSHVSFICRMAATKKYDQQVHLDYDKAIRKQAEAVGWQAFKADNSTVANLHYDTGNKVSIYKKVDQADSHPEQDRLEDTLVPDGHQNNEHDGMEGTLMTADDQSDEQSVCSSSETREHQDVKEYSNANNTRKKVSVKKIIDIKAPRDPIWQSFTAVSTDPGLLYHRTQSHPMTQGTQEGNIPYLPRDVEITIVQPITESKSSLKQEGKKRVRSKHRSRKSSTPAVLKPEDSSTDKLNISADGKSSTSVSAKRHICSHCGKQFQLPSRLKNHLRNHTQDPLEKTHICSYCSKQFASAKNLKAHVARHTRGGPPAKRHLCSHCGKTFTKSSDLKIHVRNHTGERPYSCNECGKKFTSSGILKDHMNTHTGNKKYICSYCGKQFTEGYQFTLHTRIHTGEKPYVCSYCGKGFRGSRHLKIHVWTHTGERPHKCSECGKGFTHSGNLSRHKLIHSGRKPHKCPYCSTACSQIALLRAHIRVWHTQEQPYKCPHCSKTCKQKSALNKHMKLWHSGEIRKRKPRNQDYERTRNRTTNPDKAGKPHTCSECEKKYRYLASLKVHMITHTEENPLTCPDCGKQCSSAISLRLHIMRHIQENPFECSQCGKGFMTSATLDIHTGEKPYVCSDCGKAFSLQSNLQIHKKVHTGEKDFICSYCGKAFSEKGNLQLHIMIHTGEKPFVCSECGKGFSRAADLRKHAKVHREATITE